MASPEWTIIAQTRDRQGENPMWRPEEQAIYWVDTFGPVLHRLKAGGEVESWTIPDTSIIGSFVFATRGRLVLATDTGLRLFDPATAAIKDFCDPNEGRPNVSFNDSKLDRFGRLWAGTFDIPETEPRGILYCVEPSGAFHVGDSGFTVCNGPAFSPDGRTLYFSDSLGKRILAYDVSPDRPTLTKRRTFAAMAADEGLPDGLTVDAEGCLWCAHYGASRVTRYSADGQAMAVYGLPCPVVTSMGFGGADMTTLYVTTGWSPGVTRAEDEPTPGGALFALQTGIKGIAEPEYDPWC